MNLQLRNLGTAATTNLVATLQPSSSVVAPSGPQSYGSIPIGGTAARDFSFTANAACGDSITLTLQLQDGAMNLGTVTFTVSTGNLVPGSPQTFSNPTLIAIPSSGVATPYPSNIIVSGMSSTISKVTVTLTNLTHTFPDDIDILLVSPSGRKMIIMSDAGGLNGVTNVTITLDDAAATAIPDAAALTTGSFRPGNYLTVQDPFAAPAPAGPYLTPQTGGTDTLTSAFTGMAGGNPNGTWSLYVVDDAGGDLGSISGGWSLTLTGNTPTCNANCGGVRLLVTSTLTRTTGSNVLVNYTLTNNGTLPADNTMLTTAKLGSTNGTPLPQSLGSIAPGASVSGMVNFNNMTPGAASTLSLGGTYTGGSFSSSRRVTIP
jgi:subtilisin-like proprotein convertase family protein